MSVKVQVEEWRPGAFLDGDFFKHTSPVDVHLVDPAAYREDVPAWGVTGSALIARHARAVRDTPEIEDVGGMAAVYLMAYRDMEAYKVDSELDAYRDKEKVRILAEAARAYKKWYDGTPPKMVDADDAADADEPT